MKKIVYIPLIRSGTQPHRCIDITVRPFSLTELESENDPVYLFKDSWTNSTSKEVFHKFDIVIKYIKKYLPITEPRRYRTHGESFFIKKKAFDDLDKFYYWANRLKDDIQAALKEASAKELKAQLEI